MTAAGSFFEITAVVAMSVTVMEGTRLGVGRYVSGNNRSGNRDLILSKDRCLLWLEGPTTCLKSLSRVACRIY